MPDTSAILLVDDEESIQTLLTYPLERDGYKVVQARDGEEALRRFGEEAFDPRRPRHHAAAHDASRFAGGFVRRARFRSSCSLRATTSRHRARARARCGRLHHQAVLDPASSGAVCVHCSAAHRRRTSPIGGRCDRSGRRPDRRAASVGDGARRAGAAHVRRVRAVAAARRQSRRRALATAPARAHSRERGLPRAAQRSTSTCATSARRSSETRRSPS